MGMNHTLAVIVEQAILQGAPIRAVSYCHPKPSGTAATPSAAKRLAAASSAIARLRNSAL
jgi:hypothetical protein